MSKRQKVESILPSGFQDYSPEEMIAFQEMLDNIRQTFESNGFDPLQTSIVQNLDVLTGNYEFFNMQLFRTGIVQGINYPLANFFTDLALRFDLTVPLARFYVANSNKIPKPFRRYEMGYVFRGEKAQAGRYRGFVQFDIDTIGTDSMIADAEIIFVIYQTLKNLGRLPPGHKRCK